MGPVPGVVDAREAGPARRAIPAHRQASPLAQALAAVGNRWTLLIVLALADGPIRLNTLRQRVPGVSSAVLDHHVRQMASLGLLTRRRFREVPPRVELRLTDEGAALLPIAAALARWGMRYRWGEQSGCEQIDADAVLRQLPALLEEAELPAGTVLAVLDGADAPRHYRFDIADGRARIVGGASAAGACAEEGAARIEGDEAGWTVALGPRRDYRGLRFSGRHGLARRLLDALPR